jgi:thioredoxin-like negative regulator of GroEL
MLATAAAAQAEPMRQLAARALDLERSGNYAGAATAYRAVLAEDPRQTGALLGLERALSAMGRLPEMVADLRLLLADPNASALVLGIAVRVHVAAGDTETTAALVQRWSLREPGSEAPWQEWGLAAIARQDFATGRHAFQAARASLGRPDVLSVELAQLASIEGDWPTAVREWVTALGAQPSYRAGAIAMLAQAEPGQRPIVLRELGELRAPLASRVAAVLTARWGEPVRGLERLTDALPASRAERREELALFLAEITGLPMPGARLAEGRTHELLAGVAEPGEAVRHWLDAAQAYSDAGHPREARRMLARLAGAGESAREIAGRAGLTLLAVLIEEGRLEEAEGQLAALHDALLADDRERITRRLADGWLRAGALDRAAALAGEDDSQEGHDLAGRIALYRGQLAEAAELLRMAGPYAGARADAQRRLEVLALLQVIARDEVPGLGEALYALERADSLRAARELAAVGERLPAGAGGAELRLLAARIFVAASRDAEAEPLLLDAAGSGAPAAAAAASLELARIEARTGRPPAAAERLEALILAWPGSAVAPEARRMLAALRGSVPGAP